MSALQDYLDSLPPEDKFADGERAYETHRQPKPKSREATTERISNASNAQEDYVDPYVDEMPWGDKVAMGAGAKMDSLKRRFKGMFGGPGDTDAQKAEREALISQLGVPGAIGQEIPGAVAGAGAGWLMKGAGALAGARTGRKINKFADAAGDLNVARDNTAAALRAARMQGLKPKVNPQARHLLQTLEKSKAKAAKGVRRADKLERRIPSGTVGSAAVAGGTAGAIGADEDPLKGAAAGAALSQAGPLAKAVGGKAARMGQGVLAKGYRGPKAINLITRKATDLSWEVRSELAQNRALNRILRGKPIPEHETQSMERLMTALKLPPHMATDLMSAGLASGAGEEGFDMASEEAQEALAELRSLFDAP